LRLAKALLRRPLAVPILVFIFLDWFEPQHHDGKIIALA